MNISFQFDSLNNPICVGANHFKQRNRNYKNIHENSEHTHTQIYFCIETCISIENLDKHTHVIRISDKKGISIEMENEKAMERIKREKK